MIYIKPPIPFKAGPKDEGPCPFKVGDIVYYRPSLQGYGNIVMYGPKGCPNIGQAVKITKIISERYIVYDGYDSPAGGIWWAEFSAT
jgi:hypothetical protein